MIRRVIRCQPRFTTTSKSVQPHELQTRGEWVAIAKATGMKYLVFTSRHHEGFSMFDTKADDYRITNPQSPFRRDVVKELADACHEAACVSASITRSRIGSTPTLSRRSP